MGSEGDRNVLPGTLRSLFPRRRLSCSVSSPQWTTSRSWPGGEGACRQVCSKNVRTSPRSVIGCLCRPLIDCSVARRALQPRARGILVPWPQPRAPALSTTFFRPYALLICSRRGVFSVFPPVSHIVLLQSRDALFLIWLKPCSISLRILSPGLSWERKCVSAWRTTPRKFLDAQVLGFLQAPTRMVLLPLITVISAIVRSRCGTPDDPGDRIRVFAVSPPLLLLTRLSVPTSWISPDTSRRVFDE
jgi:hypothetical protein